tara:strand:- start:142 stop:348 length:207 start_codon:yes stop_codon:yes gene_type:complete
MTKITMIGLVLIVGVMIFGHAVPSCQPICNYAIGSIATICGLHSIGRGVEDGMTKFKAVATNGKDKKK